MAGRLNPGLPAAKAYGYSKAEQVAQKKDRVLSCLGKLNDRDTQKRAGEELADLLQDKAWLDSEAMSVVMTSLCNTGTDQKVYARKEVARALTRLVASSCPMRDAALSAPFLNKLITHFKKVMQDSDSSVREAGSEGLAAVAAGLAEVHAPESSLPASQHPVGRVILECLPDGKKELQAAACHALAMAAFCCGQVDAVLVREVIKRLNTPSFQAAHALLNAIGRVDMETGAPQGLVAAAPGAFQQQLAGLVGHGPQSAGAGASSPSGAGGVTGLCGCLGSKDWQTRKAAAECVRCVVLVLGPLLEGEGNWNPGDPRSLTHRLARALEVPKFDKVKEVRSVAREAAAVLDELMAHGRVGGGTAGWADKASAAMQPARAGEMVGPALTPEPSMPPLPRARSPPQGRSSSPPSRRGTRPVSPPRQSAMQRNSSLAERFRRAAEERDSVVDVFSKMGSRPQTVESSGQEGPLDSGPASSSGRFLPDLPNPLGGGHSRAASQDGAGRDTGGRAGSRPDSGSTPGIATGAHRVSGTGGTEDTAQGPSPFDVTLSADRAPTAAAVLNATPTALPRSHRSGSGKVPSRPASGSGVTPTPPPPRPSHTSRPGTASDASASAAHSQHQTVTVPLPEWQALQRQLRDMETRQRELVDTLATLSASSTRTISELQDRIRLLEAQLHQSGLGPPSPGAAPVTAAPGPAHLPPALAPIPPSRLAQAASSPTLFPQSKFAAAHNLPSPPQPSSPSRRQADPWTLAALPPLTHTPEASSPSASGPQHPQPQWSTRHTPSSPNSPRGSTPGVIIQPASPVRSPSAGLQGGLQDVDAAYREALSAGASSAEMQRLLSRTGAAWGALQPDTAHTLLHAFMTMLQDPFTLPRVMPWLWRLADEQQAPALQDAGITPEEQSQLLAALQVAVAAWQQANHPEMAAKLQLLHQTLQSHWAQSAPAAKAAAPHHPVALFAQPRHGSPTPGTARATSPQQVPPGPRPGSAQTVGVDTGSVRSSPQAEARGLHATGDNTTDTAGSMAVSQPLAAAPSTGEAHMPPEPRLQQAESGGGVQRRSGHAPLRQDSQGQLPTAFASFPDGMRETSGQLSGASSGAAAHSTEEPASPEALKATFGSGVGTRSSAQQPEAASTPLPPSGAAPPTGRPPAVPSLPLSAVAPPSRELKPGHSRRRSVEKTPRLSAGLSTPRTDVPPGDKSPQHAAAGAGGSSSSNSTAVGGGPSLPSTPSVGPRQPAAQMDKLRNDFDALERDFMQSPAFLKARMLTEAAKERAASVTPPLCGDALGAVQDESGQVVTVLPAPKLPSGSLSGDGTPAVSAPAAETAAPAAEAVGTLRRSGDSVLAAALVSETDTSAAPAAEDARDKEVHAAQAQGVGAVSGGVVDIATQGGDTVTAGTEAAA